MLNPNGPLGRRIIAVRSTQITRKHEQWVMKRLGCWYCGRQH